MLIAKTVSMQYILTLQTLLSLMFRANVLRSVVANFKNGLRDVPGPLLARFTDLSRLHFVSDGRARGSYGQMH
jgi:hypothetical protein